MSKFYHREENLFLYVRFKDEQNKPISVVNPMVRIIYEKNGEIVPLLDWQDLVPFTSNEYCLNYILPSDAPYTIYEIEYTGEYDGKIARVVEDFHIIPRSESYDNAVKIYGFIHQARVGYPLIGTTVRVSLPDESKIVAESFTKEDGRWELYLYPGKYKFTFEKYGFLKEEIFAEISLEHNEIQFDNVILESEESLKKGNGVYLVTDKYITREGVPLIGLNVKAYNVFDLTSIVGEDTTNHDGEWQLFLDPGVYLLKVSGNSLMEDFEQTFRLKVNDNGEFSFEDLTENVGIPMDDLSVGRGDGSITVTDVVKDHEGNPIVDVQVCVYFKHDLNTLIAQDYTDPSGEWEVYLNPGTYVFEFYHPEFHEYSEERTIS